MINFQSYMLVGKFDSSLYENAYQTLYDFVQNLRVILHVALQIFEVLLDYD